MCRPCFRGEGYCGESCRSEQRRKQLRRANRRHQRSPEGRLDHRDRQRTYRQRRAAAFVTDQGRTPGLSSGTLAGPAIPVTTRRAPRPRAKEVDRGRLLRNGLLRCCVCGRVGRWLDPFRGMG